MKNILKRGLNSLVNFVIIYCVERVRNPDTDGKREHTMKTFNTSYTLNYNGYDAIEAVQSAYNGGFPVVPVSVAPVKASALPSGAVESFFNFLQASPKTVETYKINLKQFFVYLQSIEQSAPTKADILGYIKYLQEQGKKPATIAGYLSAVKALFRYLEESGLYANISQNVKAPKQAKGFKKDCLTVEQTKESLETFDTSTATGKRDYAIFLLMVVNGLRTIEVTRLTVGDLRTVDNKTVLAIMGKGHTEKDRYAILTSNVEKAIRAYLSTRNNPAEEEALFTSTSNNSNGQKLSPRTVSFIAKNAMRSAGYDSNRLTAHSLRHTAITLGLKGGITLEEVSIFARHTSINTTMIYNHSINELENTVSGVVEGFIFSTPVQE